MNQSFIENDEDFINKKMGMQRKICIVHVVQSPGGVDRYLKFLLKYMGQKKYRHILVCSNDYKDEDYKDLVDTIEHVNMIREINIKNDLSCIPVIRSCIKRYNPEIVYMHSSKAGALGRVANIGLKNICVYNPHGWAFNMRCSPIKKIIYILIEYILAKISDCIICISEDERQSALRNHICSNKKLKVIYNGIDIENYLAYESIKLFSREDKKIPHDAFVIGCVGRLSKQKAPDIFIEAAIKIKKEIDSAFFIMVGDGEMREELEQRAKEAGISDSLIITGWVEEPLPYVKLFDEALLLSRWEGFGLVLPEFMILQKPIIASAVGAIPEIIKHEVNGLLVKPDNIDEVTYSVIRLYKNKSLRQKIIDNGYAVACEKFDVKRVAAEHDELFKSMIKKYEVMK